MGSATVTSKGQVTLPADFRTKHGIEKGDRVVFYTGLDGQPAVSVIKVRKGAGCGILSHYADRLSGTSVEEAIDQAIDEEMAEKFGGPEPRT